MINRYDDPQDEGEAARQVLGIDGTMGDAQDVLHIFWPTSLPGILFCRACGLDEVARCHACAEGGVDCPGCLVCWAREVDEAPADTPTPSDPFEALRALPEWQRLSTVVETPLRLKKRPLVNRLTGRGDAFLNEDPEVAQMARRLVAAVNRAS